MLGVLSGGRLAQQVHAGPSNGGGEASVRASCPVKPMCAPFLPLKAHPQPDGALILHHIYLELQWQQRIAGRSGCLTSLLLEAPAVW